MELLLVVILIGLIVWLAIRSSQDREVLRRLEQDRTLMDHRLGRLEKELATLRTRQPESVGEGNEESPAVLPAAKLVPTAPAGFHPGGPPPLPLAPIKTRETDKPALVNSPINATAEVAPSGAALTTLGGGGKAAVLAPPVAPPAAARPASVPKSAFDWEQFVGVKLFAWLGGLALFFAAALGLKFSFEHDLIPPVVRAAGGFLLGAGLVIAGVLLKRKTYAVTSHTLCATGIVILYAVTFACRAFYHFDFFGPTLTFLLMVLITTTAFGLAVRMDAQVVAILGMLGGFLTPVLLSTGVDNPLGLFGYVALLDIGLLAVTQRRRWDYLAVLAAIGTVAMQLGWFGKFFVAEKIFIAQAVFLGFPLLFLAAFFWALQRGWMNRWITAATAGLALVALALSFRIVLGSALAEFPGRTFAIAFGADVLLLALVTLQPRLRRMESIGAVAVFLLLTFWTLGQLTGERMYWALGFYFVFAVLHAGFPLVLQRLRATEMQPPEIWSQFIPSAALLLAVLPMVRELTVPWLFWLVVLAVDVLAVLLALMTGALLGLLSVLVFTLAVAGVWLSQSTAQAVDLSESVVVIGGFALFFFGVSAWIWKKYAPAGLTLAAGSGPGAPEPGATPNLGFDVRLAIPALSAVLPFLLLIMAVAQFKPANPSPIFGLAALLLVLLLGLAQRARLDALLAVGLGSVGLLQLAWLATSLDPQQATVPLCWNLGFYAVLSAFPFLFSRHYQTRSLPWAVAAMTGPVHFGLVYGLIQRAFPNSLMGLLPAAFAVPALVGLFHRIRNLPVNAPSRLAQLAWVGGVALFFITLIFPIQFEKQWITLAWAGEGAALCWLFRRVPHPGLRGVGLGLLVTAFARLVFNPAVLSYHDRSATPILNWYLYTYGLVALSQFAAARLLASPRNIVQGRDVPPWLQGFGTVLLFLLVNIEIADFFSTGTSLTFEFSGSFARDMTYTIAWALFAFGLLLVGIRRRARLVRYASLGLLGVSLLKLFLHDLARLNQLYRIGAFAAVAVIAMVASFLYQRFLAAGTGRVPDADAAKSLDENR